MKGQEATSTATAIEQSAGQSATHVDLAQVFKTAMEACEEHDPQRTWLVWETWLYDLMLTDPGDYREQWGPLAPIMVFPPRVYPPPLEMFPPEAVDHFIARVPTAEIPASKARLNEFLWLRTQDVSHADAALEGYLGACVILARQEQGLGRSIACDYLARASDLVAQLGRDPVPLRHALFEVANELLSAESLGLASHLIRTQAGHFATDQGEGRNLLSELRSSATKFADEGGQHRHMERALLGAAASLAGALGCRAVQREVLEHIPQSLEAEARERSSDGGLVQSALLQDALKLYADLGMTAGVERAKRAIEDAIGRLDDEMTEVSASASIPDQAVTEQVDQLIRAGARHSEWAHLLGFACTNSLWPSWEVVADRTAELRRQYPLSSLARRAIVGPEGLLVPAPPGDEERREFEEIRRFAQDLRIQLAYLSLLVEEMRSRDAWSVDLLKKVMSSGDLFTETTVKAIESGLVLFEEGRHWEAVHVLAPQVERVVRSLARHLGVEAQKYESKSGEIRWASLDQLLKEAAVQGALNLIRPDWARQLRYVLADSRGWNLRNYAAHGLLDPEDQHDWSSLLMILILLCMSAIRFSQPPGE